MRDADEECSDVDSDFGDDDDLETSGDYEYASGSDSDAGQGVSEGVPSSSKNISKGYRIIDNSQLKKIQVTADLHAESGQLWPCLNLNLIPPPPGSSNRRGCLHLGLQELSG
jgi:hypothetical protein